MPIELIGRAVYALLVVLLILFGLAWLAQRIKRGSVVAGTRRRLVSIIETTLVGPTAALHVVKVGERYYLIGSGASGFSLLTEVPEASAAAWLATQAHEPSATPAALTDLLRRLRPRR